MSDDGVAFGVLAVEYLHLPKESVAMIISCPDCGSSISKASQFCPNCGSPTAFTLAMKAVRKLCKRWLLYSLGISLGGSILISLDWMGLHFAHTSILGLAVLVTGLAGLLWLANTMPKR